MNAVLLPAFGPGAGRRCRAAFTLFEILVSIAIFMMLAGGIFASVQAAFTAAGEVATTQLESEREEALQQLLRRCFQSLPGDAKVEVRLRREARGDVVELLAWPVAPFLRFGASARDGIALTALPDGRGRFNFSLAYFDAQDGPEERDRDLADAQWLTLLSDVTEVRWRLAPARNPVFSDVWTAASGRPGLVELSLARRTGSAGTFMYWVPPLQRRAGAGAFDEAGPRPPGGVGLGQPDRAEEGDGEPPPAEGERAPGR